MAERNRRAENGEQQAPALWERIIAVTGLALVAVLLAYLGYQAVANHAKPPFIVVEIDDVKRNPGSYLVQFSARNLGDDTAAGVLITGELTRGGVVVESAQVTLGYIPAQSTRGGGLFFTRDPLTHALRLHASGYATP